MQRKRLVLSAIVTAAVLGAGAASANTVQVRPYGENQVEADATHRELVRSAQRQCAASARSTSGRGFSFSGCVESTADRAVAYSGDPTLQRLHNGLPARTRYSSNRANAPIYEFDLDADARH